MMGIPAGERGGTLSAQDRLAFPPCAGMLF
jgi:hypothetical protein